jgi:hypothetical protein
MLPIVDCRTVTIRLELEVEGESVKGRAIDGPGGFHDFSGWLGLIAALDALIGAAPAGPTLTMNQGDMTP